MCLAGLLFLPTIKLKEELNQHPLTRPFPSDPPGQLDVIRVVSGRPEVSSPNEEQKAIVSIYTDNESLSKKRTGPNAKPVYTFWPFLCVDNLWCIPLRISTQKKQFQIAENVKEFQANLGTGSHKRVSFPLGNTFGKPAPNLTLF